MAELLSHGAAPGRPGGTPCSCRRRRRGPRGSPPARRRATGHASGGDAVQLEAGPAGRSARRPWTTTSRPASAANDTSYSQEGSRPSTPSALKSSTTRVPVRRHQVEQLEPARPGSWPASPGASCPGTGCARSDRPPTARALSAGRRRRRAPRRSRWRGGHGEGGVREVEPARAGPARAGSRCRSPEHVALEPPVGLGSARSHERHAQSDPDRRQRPPQAGHTQRVGRPRVLPPPPRPAGARRVRSTPRRGRRRWRPPAARRSAPCARQRPGRPPRGGGTAGRARDWSGPQPAATVCPTAHGSQSSSTSSTTWRALVDPRTPATAAAVLAPPRLVRHRASSAERGDDKGRGRALPVGAADEHDAATSAQLRNGVGARSSTGRGHRSPARIRHAAGGRALRLPARHIEPRRPGPGAAAGEHAS